jgi:hypothetical protein
LFCSLILFCFFLTECEANCSKDQPHDVSTREDAEVTINSLPIEIIRYILSFFSQQELSTTIAPVCRLWHDFAYDPLRWRALKITVNKLASACSYLLCRIPLLESLTICSSRLNHVLQSSAVAYFFCSCSFWCQNLLQIRLRFISAVNSEVIDTIVGHFPKLSILSIEGCEHFDSECVRRVCDLTRLTRLDVSQCPGLRDKDLIIIVQALTNIEDLNTDGLNYLTDR